jgi:predicted metal-dependent hydrolase
MSIKHINVAHLTIEVHRKKVKNLRLSIYPPDGKLKISAPLHVKEDDLRLFIASKLSWIEKHQARFKRLSPPMPQIGYVSGESHHFQGQRYELNVIYSNQTPKVVLRDNQYLDLHVRHESDAQKRQHVLTAWYRQELKAQIPNLIEKWQPQIGVTVDNWGIKQMKTRWGTCNIQAKRIWLNLELIKKPPHCLEYVVVHEMVHLLERYHNQRFFAYMDQFLPQWREFKRQLAVG